MEVREVHIQFDLVYQSMNSHARRVFEPQEIDWLYNEAILSLVKERTNAKNNPKKDGFEDTIKRYEDVEQLVTTAPIPLYTSSKYREAFVGFKPANFLDYIPESGFEAKVYNRCDFNFDSYTSAGASSIWSTVIDLPVDSSSPAYQNFTLTIDGDVIFNYSDYTTLNSSLSTNELRFYLISLLIDTINENSSSTGIYAYWQKFGGGNSTVNNINNGIILVSYSAKTDAVVNYTGNVINESFTQTNNLTTYSNLNELDITYNPCRVIKTTDLQSLLNHSFGSTKVTSPIVSLQNDVILVHHKKRFICNGLNLTYIRKPRKIDLNLNIHPELSDDLNLEVIDIMARKAANRNTSNNIQGIINESLLKQ